MIFASLLNQSLIYPTGSEYLYSDLSMITMHFVVGTLSRKLKYTTTADLSPACQVAVSQYGTGVALTCHYEAYVNKYVFGQMGMPSSGFRPDPSTYAAIPPTWNDTTYRHEVVQGTVSDENSYANAGISGHAGVFSTTGDLARLAWAWIAAPPVPIPGQPFLINSTTAALWRTEYNASQSSRALGWDTNSALNTYHGCGQFSSLTFTHLGYTGTEICIDPVNGYFTVLLDHRVYPNKTANMLSIQTARQSFNNASAAALGIF
jgi:CubicO group peptidase (beta-lactamase class C family)